MRAVSSETVNTARSATRRTSALRLPLPSRERVGVRVGQRLGDSLQHPTDVSQHFIVPEPENPIAVSFEERSTLRIGFTLTCVLPAVQFDDELYFGTTEVGDEWPDGMLAPDLGPGELPITQPPPERSLGIRLVAAKAPCVSSRFLLNRSPPPPPSPQGGGVKGPPPPPPPHGRGGE